MLIGIFYSIKNSRNTIQNLIFPSPLGLNYTYPLFNNLPASTSGRRFQVLMCNVLSGSLCVMFYKYTLEGEDKNSVPSSRK